MVVYDILQSARVHDCVPHAVVPELWTEEHKIYGISRGM